MAILKGFPPSNLVTVDGWKSDWSSWSLDANYKIQKPNWKDPEVKKRVEELKQWYYGPSDMRVKWKELPKKNK